MSAHRLKMIGTLSCAMSAMEGRNLEVLLDIANKLNGSDREAWRSIFKEKLCIGLPRASSVSSLRFLKFKMGKQTLVLGPFPVMGGLLGDDELPVRVEEFPEEAGPGVIELETADPLSEDERKFSNAITCSSFWFVVNGNDDLRINLYEYPDGRMWAQVARSELSAFYGPDVWYSNTITSL